MGSDKKISKRLKINSPTILSLCVVDPCQKLKRTIYYLKIGQGENISTFIDNIYFFIIFFNGWMVCLFIKSVSQVN